MRAAAGQSARGTFSATELLAMTILLLLLGVAGFGAMAGYVYFCERV